jgi:hypothetical protein
MDTMSAEITFAIASGLVGIVAHALVTKFFARTKDLVARNPAGKIEVITVTADATNAEVAAKITEAMAFENEIRQLILDLQSKISNLTSHQTKAVDFVAEHQNQKIAIEAKLSLDRLDAKTIQHYLHAEEGIRQLLLVSPKAAPKKLLADVDSLVKAGRLLIFELNPRQPEQRDVFGAALKKALRIPQEAESGSKTISQ